MSGPRLLDVRTTPVEDLDVKPIVEHLRGGGLLAYPTETVYGFGGVATDSVVNRLAALKGRGAKPMLMLVQGMGAVGDLIWTQEATDLADVFWPGSVTLILSDPNERYPAGLRGDSGGGCRPSKPSSFGGGSAGGTGRTACLDQCESAGPASCFGRTTGDGVGGVSGGR